MHKIAFLVSNLQSSQLNFYLIHEINKLVQKRPDVGIMIGYEDIGLTMITPFCPIMHLSEFYSFDGHIIATTFATARVLANMMGCASKSYYVYDLPWIRPQILPYDVFKDVFRNDSISLLCRCQDHKAIVERAWNRTVDHIWQDAHMDELLPILGINGV